MEASTEESYLLVDYICNTYCFWRHFLWTETTVGVNLSPFGRLQNTGYIFTGPSHRLLHFLSYLIDLPQTLHCEDDRPDNRSEEPAQR